MSEITGEMVLARDKGWRAAALMPALHRNREVWTALSAACASPGNGLPDDLRASIISLSLWVGRFTSEVMRGNEHIDPLIDVNMSIIGGLAAEQRL